MTRAEFRRLLAGSLLVSLSLVPLFYSIIMNWSAALVAYIGLCTLKLLWLCIEGGVVAYHLAKIRLVYGKSFSYAYFVDGVTWRQLRAERARIEPIIERLLRIAARYPGLSTQVKDILKTEGIGAARERLREAARKAFSDAQVADEKARREARRMREAQQLMERGTELGVSLERMQTLLAEPTFDRARAEIILRQHYAGLLDRSAKLQCYDVIRKLLELGQVDVARSTLVRIEILLERARICGFDTDEFRAHIQVGRLSKAEAEVTNAETERSFDKLRDALQERIGKLPVDKQQKARQLFEKLNREHYGSRPFRMALHDLESALTA